MCRLVELALEAAGKAERLLEALERNPSRLAVINACALFEELLKSELARCRGYSKKALDLNFAGLLALAQKEFRTTCRIEPWKLLGNLSRLRDCAARFTSTTMPLADVIPRALRQWFPEDILHRPCLEYLQPRLADAWKFLTQCAYMQAFYQIRMSGSPSRREELTQDFKRLLDSIGEYLRGPEGAEMLSQFEDEGEPQNA